MAMPVILNATCCYAPGPNDDETLPLLRAVKDVTTILVPQLCGGNARTVGRAHQLVQDENIYHCALWKQQQTQNFNMIQDKSIYHASSCVASIVKTSALEFRPLLQVKKWL